MDIGVLLQQMLTLAFMIAIGYCLRKKSWLNEDAYQMISRITVNVFNPLLIVDGVVNGEFTKQSGHIADNLLFVVVYFAVLLVLGIVCAPLFTKDKRDRRLYRLMLLFSNVGFMGIPVITGIYGKAATIYVIFYMLGYNVLLYTYGIFVFRQGEGKLSIREIAGNLMNAGVLASIAAIIFFIVEPPLPACVNSFCSYMGGATIPLSMLLIGYSLAGTKWHSLFRNARLLLFIGIKLLVIPIAAALLLRLVPGDSVIEGIFVLELAMPVGSILSLMAVDNGMNAKICTDAIVLSTLLSVVTIPIVGVFV